MAAAESVLLVIPMVEFDAVEATKFVSPVPSFSCRTHERHVCLGYISSVLLPCSLIYRRHLLQEAMFTTTKIYVHDGIESKSILDARRSGVQP